MHLQGSPLLVGIPAPCLDGLSAFSAYMPGQGVLWSSVAVPVVIYAVGRFMCMPECRVLFGE